MNAETKNILGGVVLLSSLAGCVIADLVYEIKTRNRIDVIENRLKSVEWTTQFVLTNAIPWTTNTGPIHEKEIFYLLNTNSAASTNEHRDH